MKKKKYISWLEERVASLEKELHESKKKEYINEQLNQLFQQWQKS